MSYRVNRGKNLSDDVENNNIIPRTVINQHHLRLYLFRSNWDYKDWRCANKKNMDKTARHWSTLEQVEQRSSRV